MTVNVEAPPDKAVPSAVTNKPTPQKTPVKEVPKHIRWNKEPPLPEGGASHARESWPRPPPVLKEVIDENTSQKRTLIKEEEAYLEKRLPACSTDETVDIMSKAVNACDESGYRRFAST